jgi:UDP-N-acetylmuramoylalanine--D-glutamate ligase
MDYSFFQGKKITVLGLGLHGGGVGTVKFLVKNGARVVVTDLKTKEQLTASLEKLKGLKNVEYVLGQHRTEDFSRADMVIKNPAVRWDSQHIKTALQNKIPVEMDSSLFFKMCQNKIIGVTGTKGKTTTSSMIAEILKSAGREVLRVGVSQVSVLDKLELLKKDTVVVFELSSWRLSALGREKLSPQVAVITNFFPDHQNYYKSMAEYASDKKNIFLNQKGKDFLVINGDDEDVLKMAEEAKSEVVKFFSKPSQNSRAVFSDGEVIFWNGGLDIKKIIDLKDLKIRGRHNWGNAMAAAGACLVFGLTVGEVKKGLADFKGIPHRLEFVQELSGVKFYNDTAATVPEAGILALDSFSEPLVLIAGGNDKNLCFADFAKKITEKTKATVFIKGVGTDKILAEISKIPGFENVEYSMATSMDEAVALAKSLAEAGDVILLSPGTASFGIFLNEFDRGEKFKLSVNALK